MTRPRGFRRTAIVVAAALTLVGVPLAAMSPIATADHTTSIALTPDTDGAEVGACNTFTAQLVPPVPNATVDVVITQATASGTLTIGFCDPPGVTGPQQPTDIKSANGNQTTADAPAKECENAFPVANPVTADVSCHAEYKTDAQGKVVFGVRSSQEGTMRVRAFVDENAAQDDDDTADGTDWQDESTKYWITGGVANVEALDCEPETDINLEGTQHTFTCTAYGKRDGATAADIPLSGIAVNFDVISGPNAALVSTTSCGTTAGQNDAGGRAEGTVRCAYTDSTTTPPGTDNIRAWVDKDQDPNVGGIQGSGTYNNGEPSDDIQKTWSLTTPTPTPTGTATTTATPTGTPTATSSGTPTSTSTATVAPGCQANGVTLAASHNRITAGNTPVLSGTVTCATGSAAGEVVTIYGKGYGQAAYSVVGQTSADAAGAFSLRVQPIVQTVYVAQADSVQSPTGSNAEPIFVHMRVQPTSVAHLGTVDRRVTVSGYILPRYSGVPVGEAYINSQNRYTFLGQSAPTSNGNWTVRGNAALAPGQYTIVFYTSATRGTLYGSKSLRLNVR